MSKFECWHNIKKKRTRTYENRVFLRVPTGASHWKPRHLVSTGTRGQKVREGRSPQRRLGRGRVQAF